MTAHVPVVLQRLFAVHETLTLAGFDHAVGGALALAQHVRDPRGTSDIDLNVTADPAHPERLLAGLPPEVEVHARADAELRNTGQTRLWWRDGTMTPLDIFLPQHETFHRRAVERAGLVDILGVEIKALTATDLMVFKLLYSRTKDWADIESLLASGAGDPDEAAAWVRELLGGDDPRLDRLQEIVDANQSLPAGERQ